MKEFTFYNPTKIVFGENTVGKLNELVPQAAKVLVIYGGESARKTGTLEEVKKALGSRKVDEFGGVEPNPTYETLMKAVEQIRREKYDFLLAVGGGSVIDGTKFIAAAVPFQGEPWDILLHWGANVSVAVPFGVVLTLPATGSEMNDGAVISKKATQEKLVFMSPHTFPSFSILDPTKTYTLPARQLANGIVDAFVHIVEQYITYPAGGMAQDRFAEGLLQTLIEIAPRVMSNEQDYIARANLMWTATLALNGLIGAGVPQDWTTHMIGHELTARYGIDHARTLAIILPAVLDVQRETKREKLLQYADRVWGLRTGDENARIDGAIEKTRHFFESVGIPTHLSAYDIGEEAIDPILAQLKAHNLVALGERQAVTPEVSRRILTRAL